MSQIASNKAFGGYIKKFQFKSESLGGLSTNVNVFTPEGSGPFPVLYYLAGLTCNEDTGPWKGGFLSHAAEHQVALVFPDTSPRGAGIAGEDDSWDFGTGAGFYLDATHPTWSTHYRMYTYVTAELPSLLGSVEGLPLDFTRQSICGHSMGGHGAIALYLRAITSPPPSSSSSSSLGTYKSASAFAPALNPTNARWGINAFNRYLQGGVKEGEKWDSTCLLWDVPEGTRLNVLIDVGEEDQFYKDGQLRPEAFQEAVKKTGYGPDQVHIRMQPGYDHSYYFISTFAAEHIKFHAKFLKA